MKKLDKKRVKLIRMEDPYTNLKKGDMGTLDFVDDIGNIHVKWDNGSSLALIDGIDEYEIIDEGLRLKKLIKKTIEKEMFLKESTDVDFKLTELKNPKVSELKKTMVENGLKVYFKLANKEFPYKAPTNNSGWDAKPNNDSHDSYLMWAGIPEGVILVGIGKNTNKAQDILKFIENTFNEGYVIKKGGNSSFWEIRIEPSQQQSVSENLIITILLTGLGLILLKNIIKKILLNSNIKKNTIKTINDLDYILKNIKELKISEFNDRYYFILNCGSGEIPIRIKKDEKKLIIDPSYLSGANTKTFWEINLTNSEYDSIIKSIKSNLNESTIQKFENWKKF